MRVEVLTYRDPDAATDVRVFIDGEEVSFAQYDCDPGAGYTRREWDDSTAGSCAMLTPAAAAMFRRWRDDAAECSPYISGEVWPPDDHLEAAYEDRYEG